MIKKARVLVTQDCPRSCEQCCNGYDSIMVQAQWIDFITDLPTDIDEVILTGGEPMLYPDRLLEDILKVRQHLPNAKVYLYTALANDDLVRIMSHVDGVHFTLHKEASADDIAAMDSLQLNIKHFKQTFKDSKISTRLYVDAGVKSTIRIMFSAWDVVRVFPWLSEEDLKKKCPNNGLPIGESLYIMRG